MPRVAFSCIAASAFAFRNAIPQNTYRIVVEGEALQPSGEQPIRKANLQFRASGDQSKGQYSAATDPAVGSRSKI